MAKLIKELLTKKELRDASTIRDTAFSVQTMDPWGGA